MQCTSIRAFLLGLGLAGAALLATQMAPPANSQTGDGWVSLFDGKSLDGWEEVGLKANWRVEDGALVADKMLAPGEGTSHLVTKNKYKNHMIYAEFWASDDANSGIFVRCMNPKNPGARTCYEVNVFDQRKDPTYGTGAYGSGVMKFRKVAVKPL